MRHTTDQIRNLALVGHQGSGKTTLAEAILHAGGAWGTSGGGAARRRGRVASGDTASDYHPEEIERQMSVYTSLVHAPWKGAKLNVLDTPGYPDFAGEVLAALRAADAAVFVMNGAEGVQVGTEAAWHYAEDTATPAMFVINHLDREESSFRDLVAQIEDRFGRGAAVVQIAAGQGTRSIIDVLLMKQLRFPKERDGAFEEMEIEAPFREEADALHNALVEAIAENDEGLMERFFEQGTLTEDEMRQGLAAAMVRRQLFPVFVASAEEHIGVTRLMDFVVNVFPSPGAMPGVPLATESGEPLGTFQHAEDGAAAAFVFRTMAEAHVGEFSYLRVITGTLAPGLDLENAQTGASERLGQLYAMNGHEREPVEALVAGDLGAVVKLKNTHTNNTLRQKGSALVADGIHFPAPRHTVAVRASKLGEEDRLANGLHALHEEDPSLVVAQDPHLGQTLLGGQGELHLDLARQRLHDRFRVDVEFERPRVSYRETIQGQARTSYRHKKQTGGAGQFADLSILVEPLVAGVPFAPSADIHPRSATEVTLPWGATAEFVDAIVGGIIDMRRFFGAIQKGITEAMQRGPIAGYPVGDVRVVVFDGGMHAVDSNENAFKTAARMAFREAFRKATPVLLEPVHHVEVTVPGSHTGDVMGDLNTRRGRIQGVEVEGFFQKIAASVPESELYRYATSLRSLTQGRGLHRSRFDHYDAMPRQAQEKLVQEATHAHDDDD